MFAQQQQKISQTSTQKLSQTSTQKLSQTSTQQQETSSNAKISIGDAFALVTLRLGRVETILQKMEVDEDGENGDVSQKKSQTNDTVILNIMNRLQE